MSIKIKVLLAEEKLLKKNIEDISVFLHRNLDKYRDNLDDIKQCLKDNAKQKKKGIIITAQEDDNLIGVAVANQTGMKGYVPSYLLVYIAVDPNVRGKGVGNKLMKKVVEKTKGDVALHVDFENPAKNLYERIGFKPKYIEMRYKKT